MVQRLSNYSAVADAPMVDHLNLDPATTTGLTFGFKAGLFNRQQTLAIDAGTVTLSDDATNFVYLSGGSVAAATTIPAQASHVLYELVTASGAITSVTDLRGTVS